MKTAQEKVAQAQQYMTADVIALHAQAIAAALEAADTTCRKLLEAHNQLQIMIRHVQSLYATGKKREARERLAALASVADLQIDLPDPDLVLSPQPGARHG